MYAPSPTQWSTTTATEERLPTEERGTLVPLKPGAETDEPADDDEEEEGEEHEATVEEGRLTTWITRQRGRSPGKGTARARDCNRKEREKELGKTRGSYKLP